MTHNNNTHARKLSLAAVALMIATLGLGTAATAGAVDNNQGEGGFLACYKEMISHAPHDPPTQEDADIATHDCCLNTGGSWSSSDYHHGFCIWPPADSQSGQHPKPGTRLIPRGAPLPTRQLS
ncbi:hypothetical protein [Mycobacterium sp. HM-7]